MLEECSKRAELIARVKKESDSTDLLLRRQWWNCIGWRSSHFIWRAKGNDLELSGRDGTVDPQSSRQQEQGPS